MIRYSNLLLCALWLGCGARHTTYSVLEDGGPDTDVENENDSRVDADQSCPSDLTNLEGTPCSEEGLFCSFGDCSDACSWCNSIHCMQGVWHWMEVFPAPCFDCGDEWCVAHEEVCMIEHMDVSGVDYRCQALPEECEEATCGCFETWGDFCEEGGLGEVTITFYNP